MLSYGRVERPSKRFQMVMIKDLKPLTKLMPKAPNTSTVDVLERKISSNCGFHSQVVG